MKNQMRRDGWQNLVTLLGTSADKRTASRIHWDYRSPEFYEQLYAGGGIPARIVDLVPDESLRHFIEWSDIEKEDKKQINDQLEELDLRGAISKAWKWGRAYGGGLLHIVTETMDPSSPMVIGERVIGLRDLSRWDVRILTTDIEFDFASSNFGHPRLYYLNLQMGSQFKGYPVHWTRVVRFDGQLVPRRTFIRNGYWHDSILNRLYNSIRNYEISNDAAAACLLDFNVDVYKMKNLANLIASGKEQIVKNRIETLSYAKSVLNAMMIDADTEEYENKSRSLEGVAELLVHQANRLVAETDIPHTKLLGESPDGSNSTGNSTSQQWYNFIGSEQENYLRPKIRRLLQCIFPDRKELGFTFKSLRVLDDTEKAELRNKQAQTDQIYVNTQVLDPSEIAKARFGGEEYNLETQIDWEARESGEVVPGSQFMDPGQPGDMGDEGEPFGTTGNKPTDGKDLPVEPQASEPEPKGQNPLAPPGLQSDITGRPNKVKVVPGKPKKDVDNTEIRMKENTIEKTGVEGKPGTQYDLRNEELNINGNPKKESFISQTMSEPFRDPKFDPIMKGPGIPNKPRELMPQRGNGVTAQSGAEFKADKYDGNEQRRAATIIVKRGDTFLMGKTRDGEKWTLPGGVVNDNESMHQGALRELEEETGIKASKLKFLGSRMVESEMNNPTMVSIYQHEADEKAKPTGKNDPDKEVSKWDWISHKKPLSDDILGNLKHPNNVALDHMKLLK